ncbi:hypothetical protein PVK06_048976 [Gossypium arboreum]|uniref:Uncharacterized protein n=1 Tax=Gossypium arboreum TaxID=29729 RepID=A0ABR0MJB4_GOSAR|nr:hypothetical protein PVK06_048976 [Gossypium arboreum]
MLVFGILNSIDPEVKEEKPKILGFTISTEGRDKGRADNVDKLTLLCTHFHPKKHEVATCFELHGCPDWWLEKYGKPNIKSVNRGGKTGVVSSTQQVSQDKGSMRANVTAVDNNYGTTLV